MTGASDLRPDRATHERSPQAVSAVPVGIPSADPTALSNWFPKVAAAGLPVPKTAIVPITQEAHYAIGATLWGEEVDMAPAEAFFAELKAAAAGFGGPFFLRTDHTSGKHYWDDACFVKNADEVGRHVFKIAEFSEICDMFGLPWFNWIVRELLPTMPVGVCPNYGNMPVCKEFRFFVNGPEIECAHPYWPRFSLEQGGCELSDGEFAALCAPDNEAELRDLASRAGEAVGGRWSVDLLETERGWFLTDMAEADKSYHWPECPAQGMSAGTAETAQQAQGQRPASPVAESDAPKDSPA